LHPAMPIGGKMSWQEWLGFIAAAGIVSAVLSSVLQFWFTHRATLRTETQKRRYLALRLAVLLEEFGNTCSHAAAEAGNFVASDGHAGSDTWYIPEVPKFPDDDEAWLALQPDLTNRCLSMPNKLEESRDYLRAENENTGDPADHEILAAFEPRCLRHGIEAWELAAELRGKNGIEHYVPEYDTVKWMRERLQTLTERQARIDQLRQDSMRIMLDMYETKEKAPE